MINRKTRNLNLSRPILRHLTGFCLHKDWRKH